MARGISTQPMVHALLDVARMVEFFSKEWKPLGSRTSLEQEIHNITQVPTEALRERALSEFSVEERMGWVAGRSTLQEEDTAYCLLGIMGVFMPLIYGEGKAHTFKRLVGEYKRRTALDSYTSPRTLSGGFRGFFNSV
ncbi:hypothetical protein BU25DRAFT_406242 [Macroventuria anomochaeta]|uniref:Uncharacterized protein n=1 Tax=Macroventuria anomochaeta TaxID=301207 RepID=A0ACB6SFA7_9PLEO|nr:uncharacterized protein BU25DRAFT_406242 [Macroventuria anomochaeta]KAF2632960.1 hypothetical protein BU25DRAFT_406242 [Macroventuria anomochaeta]